ncbi:MAG TPA: hypothetical protein VIE65_02345 [Methylobacter sp.]|jgi:hypothetical protein
MKYLEGRRQQTVRRKFEAKALFIELKSGPCMKCRQKFHHCQMDLVRPDGGGPTMASLLLKSKKRILEEASKRLRLCSNCNRMRDYNRKRLMMEGDT